MQRLIISQSEAGLTSHAGLGLIGRALNECTNLAADAKAISPLRSDAIGHANILSSSVALLCLGKSGFEAINGFREDPYFATALDLDQVPSEGTLRQRMDGFAEQFKPILEDATIAFLLRSEAQLTPCQAPCDYIPKRSYPLLQAREVLRLLAEEGIEWSGKEPSRGATAFDKSDIITL